MNLSLTHEKILSNLIYLYNKNDRPHQASEVAQTTGLNVGTIRNHMQILKMLKMAKGITGPKGGYIPTSKAFESFSSTTIFNIILFFDAIDATRIFTSLIASNIKKFS